MSDALKAEFGIIPHDVWRAESPLEIFRKMAAGEYPQPPIAETFNFRMTKIEPGRAEFTGEPKENFYNPLGTTHGGLIATLLDSTMASAIHSMLSAGKGSTSLQFKINFVRPIFERSGTLTAIGEIIHVGKQVATAEGKLLDASGKLYAHGTTTCFIYDL